MGDDRAPVYYEGDKLVIRASAIGHPCMWELIAAGQGVDSSGAPPWMKRAFQEGHDAEPGIVRQLESSTYGIKFNHSAAQQQGELLLAMEHDGPAMVVVRYHPDGVGFVDLSIIFLDDPVLSLLGVVRCVIEIKNLSDVLYQQAVRHGVETTIADYPWQLSVMMIDTGLPGLWAVRNKGKKEKGKKVYCADEGKMFFQFVPEPLITYEQLMAKGLAIKEGVDGEDLLTSDRPCDDPDHFPCLYRHVRPEPTEEELELAKNKDKVIWDVPEEMEEEYEKKLRDFLYAKGQMDEAAETLKRVSPEILAPIPEGTNVVRTSTRTFNVRNSYSSGIVWDNVPDELKAQLDQYRKSEITGQHVRDFKRLD